MNHHINRHISALDGLRFFAIVPVILHHWLPHTHWLNWNLHGVWGVSLFFVLSGFLITRILLQEKLYAQRQNITPLAVYRVFFLKRMLRIFPAYYLLIFLLYFLPNKFTNIPDLQNFKQNIGYFMAYIPNIYFFKINKLSSIVSHFWSLGVEEQFYVFFPLFILGMPLKYLKKGILFLIVLGILARHLVIWCGNDTGVGVLTPTCFDVLGMGALLAYYWVIEPNNLSNFIKTMKPLAIIATIALLGFTEVEWLRSFLNDAFLVRTLIGVLGVYIIWLALQPTNLFVSFLSRPFLVFIGKISYGLYLWHNLIPWLYGWLNFYGNKFSQKTININIMPDLTGDYFLLKSCIVYSILLLLVCTISFYGIEKPINRLKMYLYIGKIE